MGLYDDILGTKGAAPAAAAGSYDDILKTPAAAAPVARYGLRRLVADPAISAVKGAIGLTEAGVGIADVATGGEAGKAAEKYLGYKPKQAREVLDTMYSPAQQEANQRVAEADGIVGKGLALIQNPSVIGHTLIESAPSMIGGGGVARGLLKVAPKVGATLAGAIGEGVMSGGSTAEQIRQDTGGLDARQAAISAGSGALTAGLGLLGGKVAKRLGLDDVDTAIATGSAGEGTRRGLRKSLVGGMVSEGLLEEAPQSAQEQAAQNLATGKPVGEGVGAAAVTGAITGGLMGGGAAAALDLGKPKKTVVPEHISAAVEAATEGAVRAEEITGGAEQVKEALVGKVQEILNPEPEVASQPQEATAEEPTIPEAPTEPAVPQNTPTPETQAATEVAPEPTRSPLVDRVLQTGVLQIARGEEPPVELQQALADQGKMLVDAGLEPSGSVVRRNYRVVDIPEEGLDGAATQGANPAEKEAAVLQPAEAQDGAETVTLTPKASEQVDALIDTSRIDGEPTLTRESIVAAYERAVREDGQVAADKMLETTLYRLQKNKQETRKQIAVGEKAAAARPAKGGLNGNNQEAGITEDGQTDEVAGRLDARGGQDAADGREDAGGQEVALPPLQSGAQRFAYDGNGNIVVVRKGDRIALIDQKNQQLLGLASIEDGRFGEWEDGKEPATPLERVEAERVLRRHLGEQGARFSRVEDLAFRSVPATIKNKLRAVINQHGKWHYIKGAETLTHDDLLSVPQAVWKAVDHDGSLTKALKAQNTRDRKRLESERLNRPHNVFNMAEGTIEERPALTDAEKSSRLNKRLDVVRATHLASYVMQVLESEQGRLNRSEAAPGGVDVSTLKTHLAPLIKGLKTSVEIVANASEVPGLTTNVQFNGAYHNGKIYLNAEFLSSVEEAERVLMEHEIAHSGLRGMLGGAFDAVMAKAWGENSSAVRAFAEEKGIDFKTKSGKLEATEEYIVSLAEHGQKNSVWQKFVSTLREWARAIGFKVKLTEGDLRQMVLRARAYERGEGVGTRFMTAWHGSPHDFDKFSSSAIGTGEGAQAYGHGLYFAGAKEVAEWYKEKLTQHQPRDYDSLVEKYDALNTKGEGTEFPVLHEDSYKFIPDAGRLVYASGNGLAVYVKDGEIYGAKRGGKLVDLGPDNTGRLYQVELAPKEDEYLLWDKPLSEQSEKVKAALQQPGFVKDAVEAELRRVQKVREGLIAKFVAAGKTPPIKDTVRELTGKDIYNAVKNIGGGDAEWSSRQLHANGVRGIKYLDGTSRGKGDGNYNYVIFNEDDVEIKAKFNRVGTPQGARELLSSGIEVAFKTGAVLKHLGDRAFRFIFPEDRIIKAGVGTFRFNPIHEMLRNLSEYKARQAGAATDILSDVHTYAQEFKKVLPTEALRQAAAKLAFLESVYQLDGSVPLAQQWAPEYKDVPDTHPNAPEGATKRVQTNQWTPPNVKGFAEAQTLEEAYAEVKAAMKDFQPAQLKAIRALQDHVGEADLLRREALKEKNNFLFGAESEEALAANEMIDKVSRLAGRYMPLTRFGDYLVRVYEGDKQVRTESFESRSAAVDFVRQMRESGKTAELDKKQIHDHEAVNIPASFLDKIQKAAEASGLSGKNLEDFVADYKRQWAATLPDSSLRANEVRRSNMAGFDTDLLRVYEHHMQKFANAVPKIRYGVRVESTFRDMRNAIAAKAADQEFAPETVQEMLELHDSLYERQHIAEKERINSIVRLINKGVFLNYLVSPSVWLVQWSQPFMITLPKLASRFGFTASVKMFNRSAKEYLGRKYSDAKIQEFDKTHDRLGQKILTMMDDLKLEPRAAEQRLIRDRINALYNGLTAEEQALLVQKMMILRGGNDLAFSHDVTDDVAGATKMERGANWITEKGGIFMRESETGSRRAANLAAFKLEFAQSKDFAKASDYAMEVVDDTLYNFGKENRAGWMQGNAGRLIGMFQYFRLHTIAKEMQLVRDAIGRQHDQALASAKKDITSRGYSTMVATVEGETQYQAISHSGERFFSTASEEARASMPAEVQRFFKQSEAAQQAKLEARKELAFQMAMTMSFAGASGTPLAMMLSNTATDALWAALQHLFGDPDDPVTLEQMAKAKTEELVGEDAANVLSRGIFALANIDVSRRIGMGGLANLVPGDPPPGLSGSRRSEWYAARILGPTWGMMTDQMRATEAFSNGDTGKALQYASPKILKDLMKAYGLNEEGVSSATGKTVLPAEMISPWGLALQMAGINPMDVTLAREEAREVSNISTILSKRRSRLVSDFEKAYSADDVDGREEALVAISEWGQKNPKLAISQRELVGAVRKAMDKRAGKSTRREEIAAEVLAGAGG